MDTNSLIEGLVVALNKAKSEKHWCEVDNLYGKLDQLGVSLEESEV